MRYRRLGSTGLEVSEIGFGGFAIGGQDYGPTDDHESVAALERAYDLGVTFFDTSDLYGSGRSETLIGRALQGKNPPPVVATKVGFVGGRARHQDKDFSRGHIVAAAEQSLRRLRRDAIDLYQLHNPEVADLESGEAFQAMDELVAAGKVRFWGVSAGTRNAAAVCRQALAWPTASSAQLVCNLFHRQALEDLRAKIRGRGAAVIARAPLEYGMLTGKLSAASRFAPGDHRAWRWNPDELSRRLTQVEALRQAFRDRPFRLGQLALNVALSYPEVSVVICGAKSPSQTEENAAASGLLGGTLTEADLARARELIPA